MFMFKAPELWYVVFALCTLNCLDDKQRASFVAQFRKFDLEEQGDGALMHPVVYFFLPNDAYVILQGGQQSWWYM